MTRLEFDAAVQKICAAFVFPEPEDATLHAWHQVAGHMPLMASTWVVNEFIRRTARMTRGTNLGYELNALYEEYKKTGRLNRFAKCAPGRGRAVRTARMVSLAGYGFMFMRMPARGTTFSFFVAPAIRTLAFSALPHGHAIR